MYIQVFKSQGDILEMARFSHLLKEGSEFELEREMVAVDSIPWKHGYGMHEIPQLLYIVAQQIDMYSNPMNAGNEKGLTS